jgi:hypothetical protein
VLVSVAAKPEQRQHHALKIWYGHRVPSHRILFRSVRSPQNGLYLVLGPRQGSVDGRTRCNLLPPWTCALPPPAGPPLNCQSALILRKSKAAMHRPTSRLPWQDEPKTRSPDIAAASGQPCLASAPSVSSVRSCSFSFPDRDKHY